MTDIKTSREKKIERLFTMLISSIIVIIGLLTIFKILNWAISHKMSFSDIVQSNEITHKVREKQLVCLAKNIYFEAGGEPFEGKVAVAQVTVNRSEDNRWPDDICNVIYQKTKFQEKIVCQFSWVCENPSPFKPKNLAVYEESMEVAKMVLLEGYRLPSLSNALYFHADYVNPGWKHEKVTKIGRHIFYKERI